MKNNEEKFSAALFFRILTKGKGKKAGEGEGKVPA